MIVPRTSKFSVKLFGSAAFDGVAQVVQYARDYAHEHGGVSPDQLIARSLLAVAQRGALPRVTGGRRIACLDLDDIEAGCLDDWVCALP